MLEMRDQSHNRSMSTKPHRNNVNEATPEQCPWRCFGIFIMSFDQISYFSGVFIDFEQVKSGWGMAWTCDH